MRLVEIKNVSGEHINIAQVRGLSLGPGETTKVHPATVKHPAVARYIGRGLELVEPKTGDVAKEEPKAPEPPAPEPPKAPSPPPEPIATEEEKVEEVKEDTASGSLRETFVSTAPGITESNVDAVMEAFPSIEALAAADKSALIDAGVSSAFAKRLIAWASENA